MNNLNAAAQYFDAPEANDEYTGEYLCSYVDGVFIIAETNELILDMSDEGIGGA